MSEIDGINAANNFLIIDTINRKDLIDNAVLRPWRIEVHVDIGLPNVAGRHEILEIHTKSMRQSNRLHASVNL